MNSSFQTISPEETQASSSSALLLDVRTPAEFAEAHIDGALLAPLADLNPSEVQRQLAGKGSCILICGSGNRARKAAETLSNAGLSSVRVMEGGMSAWRSRGLPIIAGKKAISLERQVRIAAGSLVFIGATLGYFVHPAWIGLSAFVGAGLVFAGVTDTCGMAMLLARLPWNRASCSQGSTARRSCSL